MSSHDDDILDFDFFEDDATRESHGLGGSRGDAAARRPAAEAGRRAPATISCARRTVSRRLLRLIGFVAFAILVVVLLVVWGQGCSSDKKRTSYGDAMTELGTIGASSAKIGSDLAELLTTPGLKQAELETKLGGLIERQQQDVESAQALDVPGPLRPATDHAVEALQLRVSGMQGLLDTFVATKDDDSKNATAAGEKLAAQARRLDASDVVWRILFQVPAQATLEDEGVGDIKAPPSVFVENVRALLGPLDDRDLAPHPRRLDRRHAVRRPRHRAREGARAARPVPSSHPTPRRPSRRRPTSRSTCSSRTPARTRRSASR